MMNGNRAIKDLQKSLQMLDGNELLPSIYTLKATDNLPVDILKTLNTVEQNIKKNQKLLSQILAEGSLVIAGIGSGAIAGGIFSRLAKKKKIRQLSGKKLTAVKDNASLFKESIKRMEQLLARAKRDNNGTADYERLTPNEKEELKLLVHQMQKLSAELADQFAA